MSGRGPCRGVGICCFSVAVIRGSVFITGAARTESLRSEVGIGRHHFAQTRVLGHDFQLALPQIDETGGKRLKLVSISA